MFKWIYINDDFSLLDKPCVMRFLLIALFPPDFSPLWSWTPQHNFEVEPHKNDLLIVRRWVRTIWIVCWRRWGCNDRWGRVWRLLSFPRFWPLLHVHARIPTLFKESSAEFMWGIVNLKLVAFEVATAHFSHCSLGFDCLKK